MNQAYLSNLEYARSLQEKYEYYLIALNFTLLALSVQTAKFQVAYVQTVLELSGWAVLLIAGFIGLLRLEMMPVGHRGYADLEKKKAELKKEEKFKWEGVREVVYRDGSTYPIDEVIKWDQEIIKKQKSWVEELDTKLKRKYVWHKYLFILGVVLVMASRAYTPLVCIFS